MSSCPGKRLGRHFSENRGKNKQKIKVIDKIQNNPPNVHVLGGPEPVRVGGTWRPGRGQFLYKASRAPSLTSACDSRAASSTSGTKGTFGAISDLVAL